MEIDSVLEQLGFAKPATEIYRYLLAQKRVSARQIADALGFSRPSVYDHLKALAKAGLIVEWDIDHKKYFGPDDPAKVLALIDERTKDLSAGRAAFKKMLPALSARGAGLDPKVRFYPGYEGFRQVLTDVLLSDAKELLALWPVADMTEVVGEEYLKTFTKRRVQEGIAVRAIWPAAERLDNVVIPAEETRHAPKEVRWHMGSLVYGDKVSFIASAGERFCFTVSSREFAELAKAQFEALWRQSRRA
jgi:sugar-specific transcriptional regulator TrmB